ncbi:hypothetical protein SpAn4DRAFT_0236 [Sporomusa ovata]|uniref:Uncharacterized protein n=1 Tax=Sporomusa ovata TaxID=2378 RepID=A0A0U1L4G3_9FIRM|nr:hypothetical protein SpAn4DRAFT_0236 [Sporomusa ovata]
MLVQKTYTVDFLSKKRADNRIAIRPLLIRKCGKRYLCKKLDKKMN